MKNYTLITLIIISCIYGGFILRGMYQSGWDFPSGNKLKVFDVGLVEVFAPIWVPPLVIGKVITIGL